MPSTSRKQARFMAAVAYNPEFARKVGVPQSVGKEFHSEDRNMDRLKKLTRKYGKGGVVKEAGRKVSKVLDLNDPKLADPGEDKAYKSQVQDLKKKISQTGVLDLRDPSLPSRKKEIGKPSPVEQLEGPSAMSSDDILTAVPRGQSGRSQLQTQLHQLIMTEPSTARKLRALQRMNELMGDTNRVTDADLVQYMQSMGGGFAKGGAIGRLLSKYSGDMPPKGPRGTVPAPPAKPKPAGPLFVDSYGNKYNTPEELIVGIREAVEEESDEPRWSDAAAMLRKLPGSEPAQQALAALMKSYDDPRANFDEALSNWTLALQGITPGEPNMPGVMRTEDLKRLGLPGRDSMGYDIPPEEFAKGGAVPRLRKGPPPAGREGYTPAYSRRKPRKEPKTEEEKGREMKLSTFAKGGKVKKVLGRIKKAMTPPRNKIYDVGTPYVEGLPLKHDPGYAREVDQNRLVRAPSKRQAREAVAYDLSQEKKKPRERLGTFVRLVDDPEFLDDLEITEADKKKMRGRKSFIYDEGT